mmetsp:Transcript_166972/g.536060  ORF Transcript_166972/g.536060 Transcript_166972/m.536060 type:complete len:343 (+) Transcript_166972:3823-4851(+)
MGACAGCPWWPSLVFFGWASEDQGAGEDRRGRGDGQVLRRPLGESVPVVGPRGAVGALECAGALCALREALDGPSRKIGGDADGVGDGATGDSAGPPGRRVRAMWSAAVRGLCRQGGAGPQGHHDGRDATRQEGQAWQSRLWARTWRLHYHDPCRERIGVASSIRGALERRFFANGPRQGRGARREWQKGQARPHAGGGGGASGGGETIGARGRDTCPEAVGHHAFAQLVVEVWWRARGALVAALAAAAAAGGRAQRCYVGEGHAKVCSRVGVGCPGGVPEFFVERMMSEPYSDFKACACVGRGAVHDAGPSRVHMMRWADVRTGLSIAKLVVHNCAANRGH